MSRAFSTRRTRIQSYPVSMSYNPSLRPRPTLINNMYVEHLLETAEDEMVKHEIRLKIMDERMRREECILATSPHKVVANAVKYARAMNYTLNSLLEKRLKLLQDEFEHEFRRIIDVQQEAFKATHRTGQQSGYTRKQFKRKLSGVLTTKRREDELRRAKTQLSLPSMSRSISASTSPSYIESSQPRPKTQQIAWQRDEEEKEAAAGRHRLALLPWKHDSDAVYFPPI